MTGISMEIPLINKSWLSQERSRIQEYVYTTCLYIGSSNFAIMTVKKPWIKGRISNFSQYSYKSTQLKSRVEEIFQVLSAMLNKGEIPGSRIEVLYDLFSPVVKNFEMPDARMEIIMSAVSLKVSELFPLSYRNMNFAFSRFPGKTSMQTLVVIHGTESEGIQRVKELEQRFPGRRRLNRFSPLIRPALKICLDYQLEDPSSKLWIIELENRLCFLVMRDQTIATISYEETSFYSEKGKFDAFAWRVFLRSRYKSLVYQDLESDFPVKIDVEKVVFLSSKKLYQDLKGDLELQHELPSYYFALDESKVQSPQEFDTNIKSLMWAQCELKWELEQMDSNYLELEELDSRGLILFQYLTRHFKQCLVAVLLLANVFYSYRISQARDLSTSVSTDLKVERDKLAKVDALHARIQALNLEQKRVQKILLSKVHPTVWYERIQATLPDSCKVQAIKVQRGIVEIEGDATTHQEIIDFTQELSRAKDVEEMNLEYVNLNTDGRYNFRVVYYWDAQRIRKQAGS